MQCRKCSALECADMNKRLPAVAWSRVGKLNVRSRVNFHKPNIQCTKKSSVGLLRTLLDSCEKAVPARRSLFILMASRR